MPTLTNEIIAAAIEGFEAQKKRLDEQIAELRSLLTGGPTRTAAAPESTERKRKPFSEATKIKMKEAQQRRWAKIKGESEPPAPATVPAKPKRQMSEAGRMAIAEATRLRWAAKRAAKETPALSAKKKASRKKAATKKAAVKKVAVKVSAV
jgi:hypothetical protein